MLLIAEIILTIFAWRRGWKGYALIPGVIVLTIGIIAGLIMGISGDSAGELAGLAAFDIMAITVLIVMIAKPRVEQAKPVTEIETREK
jgi:hypothetical protein